MPKLVDMPESASASLIVEHRVPRGKGLAFRWWHRQLTRTARGFKGYLRTDLHAPVKGSQLQWYSIIHFDSPQNLNGWLKSDAREQCLAAGQKVFESYQFKSFSTGLEGWFSRTVGTEQVGLGPKPWKQNLAVVLGLYPTVMLQSFLFSSLGIMEGWPLAGSMLLNNLVTSSLLTWLVMPVVTRGFAFWLRPAAHNPNSRRNEIIGVTILAIALLIMMLLFELLKI
jgi:hypothetical protein